MIFEEVFSFKLQQFFSKENQELLVFGFLLFTLPMLISNQLILGTIVNALLIKLSISYKSKKVFLFSFLPSFAVITSGILFGVLNQYLVFMIPIIWFGNLSLMVFLKKFFVKMKKVFFLSVIFSGAIKTILIFSGAFFLFNFGLIPVSFLTIFGVTQFFTVLSGAIIVKFSAKKFLLQN
ncbi:MAG: hypothetical protein PHP82_04095 [Candidatus ainarchaeum sp.]|nr:hypothetical protein [Candidatus ainarchaeum sp.]